MKPLKIIFAGTPDFAEHHLQALINSHHHVVAVYCQPDRRAGRGKKLNHGPVKSLALKQGIPVYQPNNLRSEATLTELAALDADLMVVVAYGLILNQAALDTPKLGCINVHGSLLPRWRGAAPIQRALLSGDTTTGVTIMQMDAGLDTGAMLRKTQLVITATDTSQSLYQKLSLQGAEALVKTLDDIASGTITAMPQDDTLASYAKKLTKEEAQLDWNKPALQLWREIRAFNPWPVSYFPHEDNLIKVWQASVDQQTSSAAAGTIISASKQGLTIATGHGALTLEIIQLSGKKAMAVADILNSRQRWFNEGVQLQGLSTPTKVTHK